MQKSRKTAARDIEAEMFDVYLERGSMTKVDLIRAGFSDEEIDTYTPLVAERIRRAETARAA